MDFLEGGNLEVFTITELKFGQILKVGFGGSGLIERGTTVGMIYLHDITKSSTYLSTVWLTLPFLIVKSLLVLLS